MEHLKINSYENVQDFFSHLMKTQGPTPTPGHDIERPMTADQRREIAHRQKQGFPMSGDK